MTVWVVGLFCFFSRLFLGHQTDFTISRLPFSRIRHGCIISKICIPMLSILTHGTQLRIVLNWLLQNYDQTISNLCSLSKMLISTPTHWFLPLNFWSSYDSVSVIADLHRWWTISCNQNIGWTSNQFDSLVMFPLSIFAWLGDGPTVQL
jgi:hypothetical protein